MDTGRIGGSAAGAATPSGQDPEQPQHQAATLQRPTLQARGSSTHGAAPRNPLPGPAPTPALRAQHVAAQSLQWLEDFAKTAQADEAAVASAVLQAIRQGSLRSTAGTEPYLRKFGGELMLTDTRRGTATATCRPAGKQFHLQSISFKVKNDPGPPVKIQVDAALPPAAPQPGVATTSSASISATPVPAAQDEPIVSPTLSIETATKMEACVLRMLKWDQAEAGETIRTALLKLPDTARLRAMNHLNSLLANMEQAKMPGAITYWKDHAGRHDVLPGSDTRTPAQRVVENKLAVAKGNREFRQRSDEISGWFPREERGQYFYDGTSVGVNGDAFLVSSLYSRVMGDPRGWLASIRDICAILETEKSRPYHVKPKMLDWKPHTAQGRLDGAQQIPAFKETEAKILDLFDPATRAELLDPCVVKGDYLSPLYKRVLNDQRGSVAAIEDLHTVLVSAADRDQALLDWKAQANPQPNDVVNPQARQPAW